MFKMKKVLATILLVVLLLTIVPMAYAEGNNTYEVGDIIQFGSYPQSEVKDETLIAELNAIASEKNGWISYGYFSGSGVDGEYSTSYNAEIGDWMKYIDILYEGNMYRGVHIINFRPYQTHLNNVFSYQYDIFTCNAIYWFKFEPISWIVLNPETGLILSEKIIDSQPYTNNMSYYSPYYYIDSIKSVYANNYEFSKIRQWLNEDFYNTAFNDYEKDYINVTLLDNSAYAKAYNRFRSNDTTDNVFLLSYNDTTNCNITRTTYTSDYSFSQGVKGDGSWLLRTAGGNSETCCYVNRYNQTKTDTIVNCTSLGIRPAMVLDLGCNHFYESQITLPTCTEQGYTTYTCECGDTYTDDYTEPLHTWSEWSTNVYTQQIRYCLLCGEKEVVGDICVGTVTNLTANSDCESITLDWDDVPGATLYGVYCKSPNSDRYSLYSRVTDSEYKLDDVKMGKYSFAIRVIAEIEDQYIFGAYSKIDVELKGHMYYEKIILPSCTTRGYTTYTCECGDSYVDDYKDKLEHEYSSKITTQPTHLTIGVKTFTCECGDSYTEEIAKLIGHTYNLTVTSPSCTTQGYTTYTCECGDSYVADYVNALGHKDNNGDYMCDNGCGYEYEKPAPEQPDENENPSKDCSCNCHKSGISGFFWKIINFFNKLFKSKEYCACGAKHW